jgi:predicted  nucleic acid-binding Zn-ribbon protein
MDVSAELVKLDARVAEINGELDALQQEHDVHAAAKSEAEKRMCDIAARRLNLRKEREGLSKLRESAAYRQRLAAEAESAAKAKAEAEAIGKRLAEKEKELDALIAKAKESAPQS